MDARPRKLLFVEVPPARAVACLRALERAGWAVHAEAAEGSDELTAALLRRGWDAVLHGGEDGGRMPLTKALALVRLADAHLPVVSVDPDAALGDTGPVVHGAGRDVVVAAPRRLAARLDRELVLAAERRGPGGAYRLLAAQQGVADHLAASPEPAELLRRVLATLGDTLGWTFGAVWRPHGGAPELRCLACWRAPGGDPRVAGFESLTRTWSFAPGRGLPGRAWAFGRPAWVEGISGEDPATRGAHAARAGLATAAAFPFVAGDAPQAVAELWSREPRAPDGAESALFGAVGRQVGTAIARAERAGHAVTAT